MEPFSPVLAVLLALGLAPVEAVPRGPAEDDPPPEPEPPAEPGPPAPVAAPPDDLAPLLVPREPEANSPATANEKPEKTETKPKKKYDVDVRLRIVAGFRARATHPSADQPDPAATSTEFQLRQTRVSIRARYKKILRARASFDLADFLGTVNPGEVVRDAWANLRLHRAAQLRIGQFKRPYSRLELRGVSKIPFIGRGLSNDLVIEDLGWGDRALGAAVWGKVEPQRRGLHEAQWSVSVSNQPIASALAGESDGIDVHARGTYDPLAWLSIALGGAFKQVDDPLGATRRVFGASGDVTAEHEGLYASVEVDAAQDWAYAGESPWALGLLGYVSYEWKVAKHLRLQPTVLGELLDANLSYAQSEALRVVGSFNLLWRKYLRVLPQVELVRPRAPVTGANPAVKRETYGVWLSFQL